MKSTKKILWGIALVAVGILIILNVCGMLEFEIFFDGWWTLFIIVPCAISLFTDNDKTDSLCGIIIGVTLLLCCQDVIKWKLALPIAVIIVGLRIIFSGFFGEKDRDDRKRIPHGSGETAIFAGSELNYDGREFNGADLTAVFGGIECDLRNAIIKNDCTINAAAIFGGVDIFLPDGISIDVKSNSIFGGIARKKNLSPNTDGVTVHINGNCVFGGIDLK